MKEYATERLRNVCFVGHQSSGKSTLIEALLHNTGATSRMGRIEERNTVSDWDDDERERGLSLSTTLIPLEFDDHKINVLDAPGYIDFQAEVKNSIRVADSVFVVVDAVSGVEVGTQLAWEYAEAYQQPIIVTINKMDRENADFERTLENLRENFPDYKFIPVMLPIGAEANFKGVVNLLTMKAYYGAGAERSDMPAAMMDAARAARTLLVEAAAEAEDSLIEKYFSEGEDALSADEIRDGMRIAARDAYLKTVPVFVASGAKNIGTVPIMEALIVYVSPPSERRFQVVDAAGEKSFMTAPQSDAGPLAAYVFKTTNDRFVGTLSFFRIFSGHMSGDQRHYNAARNVDERFAGLTTMRGKEQVTLGALHCGDMGVVAKLNATRTGDTISTRERPLTISKPDFPQPLYRVALIPRTQNDTAKMGPILNSMADADPTLRWRLDADVGQTIMEGMGEMHIAVAIGRAARFGVGLTTATPRVPYKETVTKPASALYRHKKQTGGAGQFGEVTLRVEPNAGKGYEFRSEVVGGSVSSSYFPSVDKGIQSVLPHGVLAGYPIVDVSAVITDGKEHAVDSKPIAFEIAGREAFKEAFHAATPVLLEPIMRVRVTVPEAMMGDVLKDMNARRARGQDTENVGTKTHVTALVPMAEMMSYGGALRSLTGGRGIYTMDFSHYDQVPAHIAQGVIAAHRPEAAHAGG